VLTQELRENATRTTNIRSEEGKGISNSKEKQVPQEGEILRNAWEKR